MHTVTRLRECGEAMAAKQGGVSRGRSAEGLPLAPCHGGRVIMS